MTNIWAALNKIKYHYKSPKSPWAVLKKIENEFQNIFDESVPRVRTWAVLNKIKFHWTSLNNKGMVLKKINIGFTTLKIKVSPLVALQN